MEELVKITIVIVIEMFYRWNIMKYKENRQSKTKQNKK